MTDKKRIIRQFQWFEVQTKVREIISQIFQPIEKKVISHSNLITRLQQSSRQQKHKVQQITLMINNDQEIFKNGIFKNIENKFHHQTVHIKQLQNKIDYLQNYINSKAKVLDKRLEQSTEVLNGITNFKQYVKTQLNNQSNKIIESKDNIFQSLQQINEQISTLHKNIDKIKQNNEQTYKKLQLNEINFIQQNNIINNKLNNLFNQFKQLKILTQFNNSHIIQFRQQILKMNIFQRLISKLQSLVNQQIIRIDNLQYKIQVIQPIISFTQINQYAHHILPEKYHRNISIYYYNRYNQLIQEILNSQFSQKKVLQSVKTNMQLIKDVHKRATKLVFKLKKQQLIRIGVNLDHLSHQKKQQHLANIKLSQNFKGMNQNDQQMTPKIIAPMNNNSNSKQQIESITKQLKQKLNLQMNDAKKYIQNMQYQLKKDQQILQNTINNLNNNFNQFHLNFQLEQKFHKQQLDSIHKQIHFIEEQFKNIKLALRQIHDIMLVFNQIEKQDEKDRQGINLLGIRQRHRDQIKQAHSRKINRSIVDLKEQCLSCSGNPNYYNQFFKMACITYTSSPINYDSHTYQRIQILDKLQHRLQLIHHILFQKDKRQGELGLKSQRKHFKEDEKSDYHRTASNQIMKLPSKDVSASSDKFMIRNVSTSQQMRSSMTQRQSEQPRIIQASQLTSQILAKTRNRLFNRKIQKSLRESKSKRQDHSKQRSQYMINVGRYFKDLSRQNESMIKM